MSPTGCSVMCPRRAPDTRFVNLYKEFEMVDPLNTLAKLQGAINSGLVVLRPGDVYTDLGVWMDEPEGKTRLTYARSIDGKVAALAMFAHNGSIGNAPCFQTGYAVIQSMRRQGLATDLVSKGIQEMRNGFGRQGAKRFYVEAVVGATNEASNKLASRLLSNSPENITDEFSGEPAFRYVKLVEC
jgi:hypothetical protein